jgi:hypothetical protein
MATIHITDELTLHIDAQLDPKSSFLKYARNLPSLLIQGKDLGNLPTVSLSDPVVQSLQPALSFQKPVSLGSGGVELLIGAEVGGSFQVISRSRDRSTLFAGDDYGENIEIPPSECYVALGFHATVKAGIQDTASSLTFGMDRESEIQIESYRPFSTGAGAVSLAEALERSVGEFVIPADAEDLRALPQGVIVNVTGRGSLKFSGTANLLAVANPLATLPLPSPVPSLAITQSGSISIGAAWELSTEYQVRAQKVDAGHVRLGWYRKRDSEFTVTATASAGISAGTTDTDFFSKVIGAISSDAKADLENLQKAGLSKGQISSIDAAVKAAANRNLELAAAAELGSQAETEAAFLYEVDLNALEPAGESALHSALAGDLSALAGAEAPAAGISEIRSILSRVRASHVSLRVNLLGVFNFGSISKLALSGTVTYTPSTGELVIADQATASRIQTAAINFGANEDKLRHVMAESFLITATYRGGRSVIARPELSSSHVFFRLDNDASRDELRQFAAVAVSMGLGTPNVPEQMAHFGRTSFCLEARYDEATARALFLSPDGAARDHSEYELAGRRAIAILVLPDADDSYRLRPSTDDQLWSRMKVNGPANFAPLFPEATQAAGAAADYLTIQWWADAMRGAAEILVKMNRLAGSAGVSPDDPGFETLRQQLSSHLRDVAAHAQEEFGEPWGLVAMFLANGKQAQPALRITGPRFVFAAQPPLVSHEATT